MSIFGTRLGPLPGSEKDKESKKKKDNRDQRKSLQKKLNALQSIDNPSGSDRAKMIALKRRIKNLKNPRDAKTISQIQQDSKQSVKDKMKKRNTDYQRYKKGDISKEKFIRLHKDSQTAKESLKITKKKKKKMPLGERWLKPLFKGI